LAVARILREKPVSYRPQEQSRLGCPNVLLGGRDQQGVAVQQNDRPTDDLCGKLPDQTVGQIFQHQVLKGKSLVGALNQIVVEEEKYRVRHVLFRILSKKIIA
jgi:hypothetical protein